jgi:hypothetical protein
MPAGSISSFVGWNIFSFGLIDDNARVMC